MGKLIICNNEPWNEQTLNASRLPAPQNNVSESCVSKDQMFHVWQKQTGVFAFICPLLSMWSPPLSQAVAFVDKSSSSQSPVTHQSCPGCLNNPRPSFSRLPLCHSSLFISFSVPLLSKWYLGIIWVLSLCHTSVSCKTLPACGIYWFQWTIT